MLIGDMSLVGPRPCLPSQIELVEARRRLGVLKVRPGITGLAQVGGIEMSDPNRLAEIDAQYVRSQSLARVTVNDTVKIVHENGSIYIPIGAVHRLENLGKILLELIEVRTGSYLGEDDIICIEDDYQRS